MRQQAIGEASRRGANIEAGFARNVDTEVFERAFQLQPAATRIFRRGSADFDSRIGGHVHSSLVATRTVHTHLARQNHRLRFLAGVSESPLDDQHVEALLFEFWFGWHCD